MRQPAAVGWAIGSWQITSRAVLAPMAGVSDLPFRQLCREFGAGLAASEMLTSDQSLWASRKSRLRMAGLADEVAPRVVQIAGSEPDVMAAAARACVGFGAQIIDINMGCPAKKVCRKAAGSALLRDEALVASILAAVVAAVDVPVTLKIRTGWCPDTRNAVSVARIAEGAGIRALAIHGRTRACGYQAAVEYDTIAEVVSRVAIPVMANGDIHSAADACRVLDYTGAAAVMIGRGAHGQPWLFREINQWLSGDRRPAGLSREERIAVIGRHLRHMLEFYGEAAGVKICRKHVGWYGRHLELPDDWLAAFNRLQQSGEQLVAVGALCDPHGVRFDNDKFEEAAA